MDVALAALVLLVLVVLSDLFARFPRLPLPLVQIVLGVLAAAPPFSLTLELDPELFMLLFVPPLLFSDGWRASKRELSLYRGPVLMLALGLVVLTTLCVGLAIHWLIPAMPLAVAFVLGAALSPTDAMAISAMAGRGLPAPLAHVLEGETLINDASGLVAVKLAVLAALGIAFSPVSSAWMLLWTGAGGVTIGIAASALFRRAHALLTGRWGADAATANLLLLVVPYVAYLAAEHVDCSGVLAVATAGLAAGRLETIRRGRPADRLLGSGLWRVLVRALGGMVFLLVGLQLPAILGGLTQGLDRQHLAVLALEIAGIYAALSLVRFAWIHVTLSLASLSARQDGLAALSRWRAAAAATLAGVRGPITLAAALAVPLATEAGAPFPSRDLVIAAAAGVVLLSLLMATILLPLAMRGLTVAPHSAQETRAAEVALAQAAMRAVERACVDAAAGGADIDGDMLKATAEQIRLTCRHRIAAGGCDGPLTDRDAACRAATVERTLRLAILEAERQELYRLRATQRIGDPVLQDLLLRIDLVEMSLGPPAAQDGRGA